jgi:thioredoxin 1
MVKKISIVNDDDFSTKVLESGSLTVVDFWATWCEPCRKFDEVLEDMAGEYDGKISFFKVDVNQSNATASKYAVRSIPMLLFFDRGEIVDQAIGALSRELLEEKLQKLLKCV